MYYILLVMVFYLQSVDTGYDAVINLGGDAQVAYQLQLHGIVNAATLFDKLPCTCDQLNQFLENKFAGWLDKENWIYCEAKNEKYLLDIKYGSKWPMVADVKLDQFYAKRAEIQNIYAPLVKNFLNIVQQNRSLLFIRKGIRKEDAHILITTLSQLCNHENFTLVALDGSDEIKQPWPISVVKNYFLRQPTSYSWEGDNEAWKEIFVKLGLKLNDKNTQH